MPSPDGPAGPGRTLDAAQVTLAARFGAGSLRERPPGTRMGAYRLEREMGRGGMGVVYQAFDEARVQRVALKTLPRFDTSALHRLKSEFRVVAGLAHPHLVRPYELVVGDEDAFFTMELIDGVDFMEHVRGPELGTDAPLGPDGQARLRAALPQLVDGVCALHRAGLLHLDLKPANVLVERGGRVVILDFGIAERSGGATAVRAPHLAGTPDYMSPEQARGDELTRASDWFSLGVMIYEALTGLRPFEPGMAPATPPRATTVGAEDLAELSAALLLPAAAARPDTGAIVAALGGEAALSTPASDQGARFVGRRAELETLGAALAATRAGSPRLVSVHGPSGIGKSTLIERFFALAKGRAGARVAAGRCYEWESIAFKGLDALVDEVCLLVATLPPAQQRALLAAELADAAVLFPVMKQTLALPPGARPPAQDPVEQRWRGIVALKGLLRRLAERVPLVLFIDDAHWADAETAGLVGQLFAAPDAPPALLLIASRSDAAGPSPFVRELDALQRAGTLPALTTIELRALGADDAAELARARLGPDGAPALVDAIAREGTGNPFLIESMVDYLRQVDGAGEVSLHAVVSARLAALPDDARRLLRVVAVANRLDEQELAVSLAGVARDHHAVLTRLRDANLLRTGGPSGRDSVEMYHDRIRQSVLAELTPDELRHQHRAVGVALEARPATEPDVLAYHFHAAGELPRAAGHAERAAERACAALAFERGAALYRNAVAWGGERPRAERAELERRLAESLFNAGRCAEAAGVYLEAAAAAEGLAQRRLRGRALEGYLLAGHLRQGLDVARPILSELGVRPPRSSLTTALSVLGQLVRLQLGNLDAPRRAASSEDASLAIDLCWSLGHGLSPVQPMVGIDFYLRSLMAARRIGDERRAARVFALLGGILTGLGDSQATRGDRFLQRAEALARRDDDPYLTGLCEIYRAFGELSGPGRWTRVTELADRGVQRLRDGCTGVTWECAMGQGIALKAVEQTGEIAEFGRRAAEWRRGAEQRGDLYTQMAASYGIALERLARGQVDEARRQAAWNLEEWGGDGYTAQHYYALRVEALADLYEGQPEAAQARLTRAWPQIERAHLLRLSLSRFEALHLDACIRLSLPDAPATRRACARLAQRFDKEPRAEGPAHAAWIRGLLAARAGDRAGALALLDRAVAQFVAAGRHMLAQALGRRRAEAAGDAAALAVADDWMHARGVADPARWSAALFPPL